ncbi:MAG TPA: excinuclease ABC subunit UvrC, partial [bacterium]|nr:excinuclease ABC subunit UvrC [bacterium]
MLQRTVENQDFAGFARVHDIVCVAVIRRRGGRVVGTSHHFLEDVSQAGTPEILNAFLIQFYAVNTDIPKEIFLPSTIGRESLNSLEKALSLLAEKPVAIKIPVRGMKHAMLQLAEKNAAHYAEKQYRQLRGVKKSVSPEVIALQESLKLEVLPLRIEGYDISNIQGNEAVGAMVVFEDGKPSKGGYRRFKIQGVEGINDYAMMQEMLRRRFQHGGEDEAEKKRFAEPPDLILIDGGKGHLHAAMEVLDDMDIQHFPICSLAKQEEEIFLPGVPLAIRLDRRNPGLRLLQQVRDEAHRFGITYHRNLRGKKMRESSLRRIPGIGPAKERALLRQLGSLEKIRAATVDELQTVPGIAGHHARRIYDYFHGEGEE